MAKFVAIHNLILPDAVVAPGKGFVATEADGTARLVEIEAIRAFNADLDKNVEFVERGVPAVGAAVQSATTSGTEVDLSKLNKADLLAHAKAIGVEGITEDNTKAEITAAIQAKTKAEASDDLV